MEGIPRAINIADNIMVFGCGDTLEEAQKDHDKTLKEVFEMFRRTGMTVNKKKCVFNATRTKFFGYIFSADGISPDPDKVAALEKAEPPASKEEVRSFLGLAGFNSQFKPRVRHNVRTASRPYEEECRFPLGRSSTSGFPRHNEFHFRDDFTFIL